MLFAVQMSETFYGFPFSVDTCQYLPIATNKQTIKQQYLMWCRHFTQDVPQCPICAHFVSIYVCHFLFQFHPKWTHYILYSCKLPIHGGCEVFVHFCSSPVIIIVVVVVVVVVFVVVVIVVVFVAVVLVVVVMVVVIAVSAAAVQETLLSCYT